MKHFIIIDASDKKIVQTMFLTVAPADGEGFENGYESERHNGGVPVHDLKKIHTTLNNLENHLHSNQWNLSINIYLSMYI